MKEQDSQTNAGATRVCFVTNFIPPYRKSFYEKLNSVAGLDVLVVHGRVQGETGRPDFEGVMGANKIEVQNIERRFSTFSIRAQRGALSAVRSHKPNVIIVLGMVGNLTNWALLLWARMVGVKTIVWACGWEAQSAGSFQLRLKQFILRHYYRLGDKTLVYSTKGMSYLESLGVATDKLDICFNGIDIDLAVTSGVEIFQRATALRKKEASLEEVIFLYVGGLLAEKKVDLLLDAFAWVRTQNPAVKLWIVGDGPHGSFLRQKVLSERIEGVTFFGRIIDGVDEYFAAADFFVLPGLGGLAFNQAMLWGTPCIAGEADGTEDDLILDGETGIKIGGTHSPSLRAALLFASRLPEDEVERLSARARELILKRSNVDAMVTKFQRTISEVFP